MATTEWTPKLEKLIREYAAYEEKNAKDGLNPDQTVAGSMLRVAFRQAVTRNGKYKKICKKMGLKPENYASNVQDMIVIAAVNKSDAADKLKKTQTVWKNWGNISAKGVYKNLKAAKKLKIKL